MATHIFKVYASKDKLYDSILEFHSKAFGQDYDYVRDAPADDTNIMGRGIGLAGQVVESWWGGQAYYRIYRTFLHFTMPYSFADAFIVSTVLNIKVAHLPVDGNFDLTIQRGIAVDGDNVPVVHHIPRVQTDYNRTLVSGDGGSANTSGMSLGWCSIPLNATGIGWINLTLDAVSKLCLRSSDDINGVRTEGAEGVYTHNNIYWYSGNTFTLSIKPYLNIEVALSVPTATTQAATDIDTIIATFNGTITNNGWWINSYGFEWKEGVGGDVSSVTVGTSQSVTTFDYVKTGLNAGTTYYVRAWGYNEAGKGYGEWVEFETLSAEPVVTTEAPDIVDEWGFPYYHCARGHGTIVSGSDITERGFEVKVAVDFYGVGPYVWWHLIGFIDVGDIVTDMGQWTGTLTKTEYDHGTPYDPELGAFTVPLGKSGIFPGSIDSAFNDALEPCTSYTYRAYAINDVGTGYGEYVAFNMPCYPQGHLVDDQIPIDIPGLIPIEPIIVPIEPPGSDIPNYEEEWPPFEIPEMEWPEFEYPEFPPYNGSWLGPFYYRKAYTKKDLDELRKKCKTFLSNSVEFALVLNHNMHVLQQFLNVMYEYMDVDEYNTFKPLIPTQWLNELARKPLDIMDFQGIINDFISNSVSNASNINHNFRLIEGGLRGFSLGEYAGFNYLEIRTKTSKDDSPDVERLKKVIDTLNVETVNNFETISHNLKVVRSILL